MRTLVALTITFFALLTAGSTSASTFYAVDYNNDEVLGFNTQADGSLVALTGSPFSTAFGGTAAFALTSDGTRAVAAHLFLGGVRGFVIDAAGAVSPAQTEIAAQEANGLAVSPDGRFAYAPTRSGAMGIQVYSIDASGALIEVAGSPFATGVEHNDVALTPNGKFLFSAVVTGIRAFAVQADGSLVSLGTTPLTSPRSLNTSPDGRFLFTTSKPGVIDIVSSYSIGADGALSFNIPAVSTGNVSVGFPGISPDGGFIYAPDSNDDSISTIRVNPDGTLSAVGVPFAIDDVEVLAVSPDGKHLYAQRFSGPAGVWVSPIGADGRPVAFTLQNPVNPTLQPRFVFRPDPVPVAEFTATARSKPLTVRFDSGPSTIARGAIGDTQWDFDGNGTVDGSNSVIDKTFPKPGVYQVNLRLHSAGQSCPDRHVYFGQSTICADPTPATKTITFDTPPWIKSLKVSPRALRRSGKVSYTLTEKARVTFFAERKTVGRTVGGKCRRATRSNRRAKKCTLWVRASKSFRHSGKSGRNSIKFTGKIAGRRLVARSYRLNATAVDSAKGKSPARTAKFKIR